MQTILLICTICLSFVRLIFNVILIHFSHGLIIDIEKLFLLLVPMVVAKGNRRIFFMIYHQFKFCRTLLRYCFRQLRSTQVAILHCSAQTSPIHVIQKLNQSCIQVSSTNGRTYRPKDCENLILYVKDINLPKLDKWGTSQLIEFLQQVRSLSLLISSSWN